MLTNDDIHSFLFEWGRAIVDGFARGIQSPYRHMMRRKIRRAYRNA